MSKSIVKLKKRSNLIPQTESFHKNVPVVVWNACHNCRGVDCSIADRCEFCGEDEKCLVMYYYLDNVFKSALRITGEGIGDQSMNRIGLHIIPLYAHLVKFKIEELSIEDPMIRSRNKVQIHPIYKEIRNTISLIDKMWVELGLKDTRKEMKEPGDITDLIKDEAGDTSYYEDMINEVDDND